MGPPPPPLKIFRFANQRCSSSSSCAKIFAAILRTFGSTIDSYSLILWSLVLNILKSQSIRFAKKSSKEWKIWKKIKLSAIYQYYKPCPKFSRIYQKNWGKSEKGSIDSYSLILRSLVLNILNGRFLQELQCQNCTKEVKIQGRMNFEHFAKVFI